jgi:hypothetical protein
LLLVLLLCHFPSSEYLMLNLVTSLAIQMGLVVKRVAWEQTLLRIHSSAIDDMSPRKATEGIAI